jgi:hypothetical protein
MLFIGVGEGLPSSHSPLLYNYVLVLMMIDLRREVRESKKEDSVRESKKEDSPQYK